MERTQTESDSRVTDQQLIALLESSADGTPAALTFDADGTLWSGDVGEDCFLRALREGVLREPALPALEKAASAANVSKQGGANAIARRLWDSYEGGAYDERAMCEVMTWCWAGWTLEELNSWARETFEQTDLRARTQRETLRLVEWARERGFRACVISASPRQFVEPGAELLGFASADVTASTARVNGELVLPELLEPIPYGAGKVRAGRALLGAKTWLAAFGDSAFDADMLREARVGVAVRPKPALRQQLRSIPGAVELEPSN